MRSHHAATMSMDKHRKDASLETALNDNSHYNEGSNFMIDNGAYKYEGTEYSDEEFAGDDVAVVDVVGADFDVGTQKRKKVRKRTSAFVEEINQEPETVFTSDADAQPPIEADETTQYVRTVVRAADKRKAEDILAIRVSKLTYICSFIVIVSAKNAPQMRAVANLIEEELAKSHDMLIRRKDGTVNSGWILLDCR